MTADEDDEPLPPLDATNPAHYRQGSMEVIDAIEGMGLGYHEGNVVKYVARWKFKNGIEDLRKSMWYLNRLIANETARLQKDNDKEDGERNP